jgi:putative sugar O-methyltransferase
MTFSIAPARLSFRAYPGIKRRGTVGILERVEALRGERPYQNYPKVREAVLAMCAVPAERIPAVAQPSGYWAEELSRFIYMFDASPLIIEQLRHHTHHLTGIPVYSYRTGADRKEGAKYLEKINALRALDEKGLFVPEAPELGGFGHEIEGKLANIDTLKFYECMIAMDRGGALQGLRESKERQVVLEIGTGWGGLAYTFKTLFPKVCYVLVDFPELFLFSATYLMTLFPDAKVAFVTDTSSKIEGAWADYDFIFVPNTLQQELRPERLDLTLNTVSFQEMTSDQVRAYVGLVAGLDCPLLYSLNRGRSLYATELTDVHEIIGEHYALTPVPMLSVPYGKMLEGDEMHMEKVRREKNWRDADAKERAARKAKARAEKADMRYAHMIGRKRQA